MDALRPTVTPIALALFVAAVFVWSSPWRLSALGSVHTAGTLMTAVPSSLTSTLSLRDCNARNQLTRDNVVSWIARADWEVPPSMFHYGLPGFLFPFIDLHVGPYPIGHDLVSFLGTQLKIPESRRLHYLEIGVSVGKGLMTQLQFFGSAALVVAYDIEDINPTFARMLTLAETMETFTAERLQTGSESLRRRPGAELVDTIKRFTAPSGGELIYINSDEFNFEGWERFQKLGHTFDLIYSDASHTPGALLFEADQLLQRRLINLRHFVMVWDDCVGDMISGGVCPIVVNMRRQPGAGLLYARSVSIGGWVGVHEEKHNHCIVSTLELDSIWRSDELLASGTQPLKQICT